MSAISIEHLSYSYPKSEVPALRDISLTIEAGEFVLIAGHSGAGKSTLLRCINGLVPHFSGGLIGGKIMVGRSDPIELGPRSLASQAGFVFQNPESQSVLDTVEAEIVFGMEVAGIPRAEMKWRLERILSQLEMTHLRIRKITTLSGGERQRVAIAAALIAGPSILLLDEPTSQLDPKSAADVLEILSNLNQLNGLTVLLVEQRLERVVQFADRLVYLENGEVAIDAPIRQALSRLPAATKPPLVRLANHLGSRNVPLTVEEGQVLLRWRENNSSTNPMPAISYRSNSKRIILDIRDLHFQFDELSVLGGVNLQLSQGESVALVGRNGVGKTTFLKCLLGLLRPERGQVILEGEDVTDFHVSEICRRIAYLPQSPDDLLFSDSVREELELTLKNHGYQGSRVPVQPSKLLEELDLLYVSDSYPRDLSAGQRQRVALATIMVTKPTVMLLDEPTRGLDYEAKTRLEELLRGWREAGLTLLLVTHDVELVAKVADRVAIMSDGKIVANGPTGDILSAHRLFSTQTSRIWPERKWLTFEQAVDGLVGEERAYYSDRFRENI